MNTAAPGSAADKAGNIGEALSAAFRMIPHEIKSLEEELEKNPLLSRDERDGADTPPEPDEDDQDDQDATAVHDRPHWCTKLSIRFHDS